MTLFSAVELAPRDPILGLNEAYNADHRPNKVNLGVGVYFNAEGKLPLLKAVKAAEEQRVAAGLPRGYLPMEGIAAYDKAVQEMLFGKESPVLAEGRVVTAQALGGTGALKIGADFLKQLNPNATVAISDPSWENHRALFTTAGFNVVSYPYYDAESHGVNLPGMLDMLGKEPEGTIVVLHACCHNPTGVDLTMDQWAQVVEVVKARKLVPFLDIAYQGFGHRCRRRRGTPARCVRPDLLRVELVFQVVLAVRRTRGRAVDRHKQQGRNDPRALAAQARDPHQLLEPADAWWIGRCRRAGQRRASRPVGRRAGRDA